MKLPGVIAPLITPYTDELEVDVKAAVSLARRLARENVGVLIAGTTGEMPLLSVPEKVDLISKIKSSVSDVVIAGVGGPNPYAVFYEADKLTNAGADVLLVPPPYYYKPPQYSVEAFYNWLAREVGSPVIVYNIPSHTGVLVSVSTLKNLAGFENIIGVKATVDSINYQSSLINELKNEYPDFLVYSGSDNLLLFNLSSGGDGGIVAGANLVPKLHSMLYKAFMEEDYRDAINLHKLILKIQWVLEPARSIQGGIKDILAYEGFIQTPSVRPPIPPEDEASIKAVVERWKKSGLRDYL